MGFIRGYNNGDNMNQNYDQNQMLKSVGNFGDPNQYMKRYDNEIE